MCSRKPGRHGAGSGTFNRDDVRWALGVVRSRAVWIARRFGAGRGRFVFSTLGRAGAAFGPASAVGGAGGTTTLGVDNVVTVTAGSSFAPGAEVVVDRGTNSTDAEQLLAYHALAPGVRVDNAVRLNLPGAEIAKAGVIRKVELLRTWRREMAMPPRGADLWRDARGLGLYGDGDEDEVRAMGDAARASAKKRRSPRSPRLWRRPIGRRDDDRGGALAHRRGARPPRRRPRRLPRASASTSASSTTTATNTTTTTTTAKPTRCTPLRTPTIPAGTTRRWITTGEASRGWRLRPPPRPRTRTSPAAPTAPEPAGSSKAETREGPRRSRRDAKRRGPRGAERRRERHASGAAKRQGVLRERRAPAPGFRPARPLPPSQGEAHVGVRRERGTF